MRNKFRILIAGVALIAFLTAPAFAATKAVSDNVGIMYDSYTGQSTYFDAKGNGIINETEVKLTKEEKDLIKRSTKRGDVAADVLSVFDSYKYTSGSTNARYKWIGTYIAQNTTYNLTGTAQYQASQAGSWSGSISTSCSGSTEINAVLGKIQANLGVTATVSRSWTTGVSYGASYPVPPRTEVTITAYIPAAVTSGYKVYRVYNTTTGGYTYQNVPISNVSAPLSNSWTTVASSKAI